MEKKHDLEFCPGCGVKLDGDEFICAVCGYKIAELHPIQKTQEPVIPPSVIQPPIVPPVITEQKPLAFCPECGAKLEGNELFCNSCGHRLSDPVAFNSVETPVVPPLPVSETPVIPPPPPATEVPFVPPVPVIETPDALPVQEQTPVIPSGVNKDILSFCPNCGCKIDSEEIFCNGCGFNLKDQNIAPPVVETPITPPVYQNTPPIGQPTNFRQTPVTNNPSTANKKKGMGAGGWILIIFLIIIVIGGGTVSFLQYNGNVDIAFLRNIIPAKNNIATTSEDPTRYYIVHSFSTVGPKWVAIISNVVVSKRPFNSNEGAGLEFKKAIMRQFPQEYRFFTNTILVSHYLTFPEAVSAHSSYLRSYGSDKRHYEIRIIDFTY